MPSWLIDALREPGLELVNLLGLALLAAVQARIRGKQNRLRDELRQADVLPHRPLGSSSRTKVRLARKVFPGQPDQDL